MPRNAAIGCKIANDQLISTNYQPAINLLLAVGFCFLKYAITSLTTDLLPPVLRYWTHTDTPRHTQ